MPTADEEQSNGTKEDTEDSSGLSDNESDSSGDSSCDDVSLDQQPPQRLAFVIMTCVIGGYTLIGPLQHNLKHALHIADTGEVGRYFTQSVAFVQWGKTFMTVGQNVVLGCLPTISRVYLSMVVMFLGTLIPPLCVFTLGSNWLGWVPMSYGMIGLALGVFECTFLSVISPLGPSTKSWAIMGFPAAFGIVNIFGQSLMALLDMPVEVIFWYIVACQPLAIALFVKIAPAETKMPDGKSYKQAGIRKSLTDWRSWLLKMVPFLLVNICSHFTMESVLPAVYNTYNSKEVALLGPTNTSVMMSTRWFLVVFAIAMAIADMGSRRIGYCFQFSTTAQNYMGLGFSLSCSVLGLYLATLGIALVTWLAGFLAFFGSGFNYAVTSKYIDKRVPRRHNLAGYSVWMFVGYMGAIAGAVLVDEVRGWICNGVEYEFQCH